MINIYFSTKTATHHHHFDLLLKWQYHDISIEMVLFYSLIPIHPYTKLLLIFFRCLGTFTATRWRKSPKRKLLLPAFPKLGNWLLVMLEFFQIISVTSNGIIKESGPFVDYLSLGCGGIASGTFFLFNIRFLGVTFIFLHQCFLLCWFHIVLLIRRIMALLCNALAIVWPKVIIK